MTKVHLNRGDRNLLLLVIEQGRLVAQWCHKGWNSKKQTRADQSVMSLPTGAPWCTLQRVLQGLVGRREAILRDILTQEQRPSWLSCAESLCTLPVSCRILVVGPYHKRLHRVLQPVLPLLQSSNQYQELMVTHTIPYPWWQLQAKERAGIKLLVRLVLLRDDCSDVNVLGIHLHNELIGIVWMKANIHRSEQFLKFGEGCLNRPHEGLQGGDKSGEGGCQLTGVIDKMPIHICKTQEALRLLLWRWSGPLLTAGSGKICPAEWRSPGTALLWDGTHVSWLSRLCLFSQRHWRTSQICWLCYSSVFKKIRILSRNKKRNLLGKSSQRPGHYLDLLWLVRPKDIT